MRRPELPGPRPHAQPHRRCHPQGWGSDPKLRHCYKVGSQGPRGWGKKQAKTQSLVGGGPSGDAAMIKQVGPGETSLLGPFC